MPKMAFGTGSNETTQLCLELLENYLQSGDYENALENARENIALNRVKNRVELHSNSVETILQ